MIIILPHDAFHVILEILILEFQDASFVVSILLLFLLSAVVRVVIVHEVRHYFIKFGFHLSYFFIFFFLLIFLVIMVILIFFFIIRVTSILVLLVEAEFIDLVPFFAFTFFILVLMFVLLILLLVLLVIMIMLMSGLLSWVFIHYLVNWRVLALFLMTEFALAFFTTTHIQKVWSFIPIFVLRAEWLITVVSVHFVFIKFKIQICRCY